MSCIGTIPWTRLEVYVQLSILFSVKAALIYLGSNVYQCPFFPFLTTHRLILAIPAGVSSYLTAVLISTDLRCTGYWALVICGCPLCPPVVSPLFLSCCPSGSCLVCYRSVCLFLLLLSCFVALTKKIFPYVIILKCLPEFSYNSFMLLVHFELTFAYKVLIHLL